MSKRHRTLEYMLWLGGLSLPAVECALLYRLCLYADDEARCWPGLNRLARDSQLSPRTINRKLKELTANNVLEIERREGRPLRFRLRLETRLIALDPCQRVTGDSLSPVTGAAPDPCQTELLGGDTLATEETTNYKKKQMQENARAREGRNPALSAFSERVRRGLAQG